VTSDDKATLCALLLANVIGTTLFWVFVAVFG
jgi:hypothetical protein